MATPGGTSNLKSDSGSGGSRCQFSNRNSTSTPPLCRTINRANSPLRRSISNKTTSFCEPAGAASVVLLPARILGVLVATGRALHAAPQHYIVFIQRIVRWQPGLRARTRSTPSSRPPATPTASANLRSASPVPASRFGRLARKTMPSCHPPETNPSPATRTPTASSPAAEKMPSPLRFEHVPVLRIPLQKCRLKRLRRLIPLLEHFDEPLNFGIGRT